MRAKTSFSCQACGHQSPRWLGRCPDCSGWNTMKEERQAPTGKGRPAAMKMAQAKATPIAETKKPSPPVAPLLSYKRISDGT